MGSMELVLILYLTQKNSGAERLGERGVQVIGTPLSIHLNGNFPSSKKRNSV